jgi:hypothetical protein
MTTTCAALQIDAVHTRAICDEIGERLRGMLQRQISRELPPRLEALMEQLAGLDNEAAPSIIPSLDDMTTWQRPLARQASSQQIAAPAVGTGPLEVSSR